MAAPVRFLSGRQQQQKIGIEGSTQNEKVLEVVGRVGIGTTVFDTTKALDVRGDVEISGIISATRFLGDGSQLANLPASGVGATDNVNTSGIITASTFSGKGDFTNLSVSGLSTFSSLVDINANLDVTGHSELDDVNVSGVSTFTGAIDANGGLDVSGGSGLVANTAKISDLTDNRVVIAGASGELEDSSKLTFDGTKLAVDGNLGVTGLTTTQNLNVAGVSTFVGLVTVTNGDVHIAQRLFVGGLEVEGTGSENTFTGINTFTNQQDNTLGNTNTGSLQGNGGLGIDKNASFGDKVFVQNAIGINSTAPIGKLDVNGHTELDDVNVSAALTAASLNVTNKLTTTGLGISVANGTGNTAYIEGPSEIWIDPAPAGAGTTSGLVRIRGDLYVDGTEFIVDVDKVQLSDYRIGIATTAGTNALLDGAGLGIGSESIEKTITWNNATSALMSSENWNLASGKHYEIAGTDVLTSTTLGGGVVNSSLTSVGTLGSLTVSGDITANGNIVGDNATNISNINQVTATTFSGALSGNATSATTATNVTVADESSDTTCNVLFTTGATGNLAPKSGTNLTFNSSNGTLTATEFSGGGAGITGLTASQVGAIADIVSDTTPQLGGNLDVNNKDITGTGNVNLTGIVTATNFVGGGAGLTGITAGQVGAITDLVSDTTPQLGGNLDLNSKLINGTGGINVTGIVTASSFDGNITGIATYTSEWIITSNGSSDYRFTGPGFDGTENDPTIYLVRGQEYKFTNNMGAHPFQIRTAINGSAYNDGITNNGVSNGTLTWDVQMDAPNVLYYQCTAHAGMVGKIYIGNSGDSVNVGTGVTINAGGINVTGVVTATSFVGNGAGLTGLTANQVGAIGDVVSDTTPQLGGNLDLNSKTINGTGTINFTGNVTATAFAGSGANLTSLPVPTEVIVTDESSDTSCNVLFTTAATGNQAPKSGTNLTFNSSSGTLTATAFSGDGSALTNLPAGTTIPVADESSDTECFLVFTTAATGDQAPKTGTNLTFNSASGILTATTFSGSGASLTAVDAATLDGVDSTSFLRSDAADSKTSGDLTFSDGVKAIFGTGSDLEIYHSGGVGSYIEQVGDGTLTIRNSVDDGDVRIQSDNSSGALTNYFLADGSTGEAILYHYGSQKLATKSGGATVTGTLTATTFSGSGASLTNVDADTLDGIDSGSFLRSDATDVKTAGNLTFNDNVYARFGTDADMVIYHNDANAYISNSTGSLYFTTAADNERVHIQCDNGSGGITDYFRANGSTGEAILYHYGTEKLATKSGGVTVTGTLTATTFSGALSGNATSATTATNVTVADESSDTSCNVLFTTAATGNLAPKSGTNLTFNSSSGTLTATAFSGDGSALTNLPASTPDKISEGNTEVEVIDTGSNGHVKFTTEGSERARIDPSGRLGIGVTNPGSTLEINVGTATSAFDIQGSAGQLFSVTNNLTSGSIFSVNDVSGIPSIDVDADGTIQLAPFGTTEMVGIGTTNPTSKLHVVGDARVTGVITATSFSGSGANLTGISFDLVNDTTPQLGGTLDTNGNLIQFGDSGSATDDRLQFGASQDLSIYHDGVNSRIVNSTEDLYIQCDGDDLILQAADNIFIQPQNGENGIRIHGDGSTELYYDNNRKLETTAGGIDVNGEVQCDSLDVDGAADITGNVTLHANLDLQDNDKILIGTGDDLEIYHDGTNSYVSNTTTGHLIVEQTSTGDLILRNTTDDRDVIIQTDDGSGNTTNYIRCEGDTGEVGLYHYGSQKLATTGYGATVTGGLQVSGIVTATSFAGDGSALTGISAGGSPEFYTGITSSTQITPLSFETAVFTFPSTSGRQYVIESINVANVDESVGVGTTVNIIASIEDATAAEQTYIAYNVPIVTGGLIELLKNPIVAGPSDVIRMWTTNDDYVGVNNAADVYINYTEFESTDYISKFASSTTINSTDTITLYTSTGNPTMIEKIGFANRTDTGDFPVSIKITNGVTTSYLAKNLIIPRYSTVDILDRHKRIETGAKIEVEVGSTNTVDVIISGKKITS